MSALTIRAFFNGEIFTPQASSANNIKLLEPNQVYVIEPEKPRSYASHKHHFAWLNTAFLNLPEKHVGLFTNSEHLRKYALIKTGFCLVKDFPVLSMAEAERTETVARALADKYSIVVVQDKLVRVFTAQSQSVTGMGGKRFQESKSAIREYIAALIGVEPIELDRAKDYD